MLSDQTYQQAMSNDISSIFTDSDSYYYVCCLDVISSAPVKIENISEHSEITVAIGKNHTAQIIIDNDALKALKC